jgi:hypothetical protein
VLPHVRDGDRRPRRHAGELSPEVDGLAEPTWPARVFTYASPSAVSRPMKVPETVTPTRTQARWPWLTASPPPLSTPPFPPASSMTCPVRDLARGSGTATGAVVHQKVRRS